MNTKNPILNEIFTELSLKGLSTAQIADELLRSKSHVLQIRLGDRDPRLIDLQCLATLAGGEIRFVKTEKDGKESSND